MTRGAHVALLAGLVAVTGFLGVGIATRARPGVSVDSAEYLSVAQGLRDGHGLTSPYLSFGEPYPHVVHPTARTPLGHFPPLYPVVLAELSAVTGTDPLTVTRWLGAASLAAVAAMVTYLVAHRSGVLIAGAVAGGLVLAPDVLVAHSMAWTEALFGLLLVSAVALLDAHLTSPSPANAGGLILVAAAAPLARYAGIAVPVGVVIALLVAGPQPSRWRRLGHAALIGGPALLPLLAWVTVSGHGVARGSAGSSWHPPDGEEIRRGFAVSASWLDATGPQAWEVGALVLAALTATAVANGVRLLRRRSAVALPDRSVIDVATRRRWLTLVVAVMAITYLVTVVLSRLFIDAAIPFDARLLVPVHLMAVIGLPLVAVSIDKTLVRRAALLLAGLVAVITVAHSVDTISAFPHQNAGYLGRRWRRSAGLEAIRNLRGHTLVVTNAPDPVWLHTRRPSLFIPLRTDLYADRPNPSYIRQLRALDAALHDRVAVIVFFHRPTRGGRRSLDRRVLSTLHFQFERRLADATIYRRRND